MSDLDQGYRNPDQSRYFEQFLETLNHYDDTDLLKSTRRALDRRLGPKRGNRFLDAGCGTGTDALRLARKGASVVGVDISRRFLDIALSRSLGTVVRYVRGSVDDLPFANAHLDGAFAIRTLQYLDDPLSALRELARVTRRGGKVAVVEGGMARVDLPDETLTRLVFGPHRGFGMTLPALMLEAGLTNVCVDAGFGAEIGIPDSRSMDYAREAASGAVADGIVTQEEATDWLARLDGIAAAGRWFSADVMFVVSGTV